MATQIQLGLVHPAIEPQHFTPPTARERRAQAIHRLQVGVTGLAAMLLLVGLANIIMDRARLADAQGAGTAVPPAASTQSEASDPLADIGVVPAVDASASGSPGAPRR